MGDDDPPDQTVEEFVRRAEVVNSDPAHPAGLGGTRRLARVVFNRAMHFTPKWTREVFVIVQVLFNERPIVYTIKNLADELIDSTFYERYLQQVGKPEVFVIKCVVKRRMRPGVQESFVKWSGYPDSFNS